jgi:hypothetical protein
VYAGHLANSLADQPAKCQVPHHEDANDAPQFPSRRRLGKKTKVSGQDEENAGKEEKDPGEEKDNQEKDACEEGVREEEDGFDGIPEEPQPHQITRAALAGQALAESLWR